MSTALYLWPCSSNDNGEEEERPPPEAASKPRSKRAAKAGMPKRQPQRGLGVAQLERLRMQEKYLGKFPEIDRPLAPAQVPAALDPAHGLPFPFPFPAVVDTETGVSMARLSPQNYFEAFAEAQMAQIRSQHQQQQCALQRYRMANGCGVGMPPAAATGVRGLFSDPTTTQLDRCRIAAPDVRFHGRNGFPYAGATSVEAMMVARELSSSQRTQCFSNQCEACTKQKRFQSENLGFQESSTSSNGGFLDMGMNGGDLMGMNIGSGRAVDGGSRGFGGRGEWRGSSSGMHVDEEMEDVKKSVEEYYIKEYYEFFPRKDCSSSRGGGGGGGGSGSAAAVGAPEASVAEAAAAAASSNFLDLSLKLSY